MPFLDIPAIKRDVRLFAVLDHIGWKAATSKGGSHRGACPLHSDDNHRSRIFVVTGEDWYCHKCKVGGGALELWKRYYKQDTYTAALDLCKQLGLVAYQLQRHLWADKTRNKEEEQ